MAKVEPKTRKTEASVEDFLDALTDEQQRDDSHALIKLMKGITKAAPKMWGPSIIGFGATKLKYASGRELEWPVCAFSPRKGTLSIYLTCDIAQYQHYLAKLGKHKVGKGCLYVKRLADVDAKVLKAFVTEAVNGE